MWSVMSKDSKGQDKDDLILIPLRGESLSSLARRYVPSVTEWNTDAEPYEMFRT